MKTPIEQLRKELMICQVEQGFFNMKVYLDEMKKLEQIKDFPMIYKEIMYNAIHDIIRDKLDAILGVSAQ